MVQFAKDRTTNYPGPLKQIGRAAVRMRQYEDFVNQVGPDEAGKLTPEGDETTRNLAMRVSRAARRVGKKADTWTRDGVVYFTV